MIEVRINYIQKCEDDSLLKQFDKTPKPLKALPNVEMASQHPERQQPSQQSNKVEWMRQQMAQMQAMMEQMSRAQPVDPKEKEQEHQNEHKMAEIQLQIADKCRPKFYTNHSEREQGCWLSKEDSYLKSEAYFQAWEIQ